MIKPNADISVIRIREGKLPEVQEIYGVHWQQTVSYTVSQKAAVDTSEVFILIPKKVLNGFNGKIQKGDYIVRETGLSLNTTGKQLRYDLEGLGAVLVKTIDDFMDVAIKRPHIELRCV